MSHQNVEIVRKVYAGVVASLELAPALFTQDFVLDLTDVYQFAHSGLPDFGGVMRGVEAAEGAMQPYWKGFDDFHVEIEEVIHADGERVVDVVRDRGYIRGSDTEISNRFFHVHSFRDGRIARLSIHTDRSRAFEAAGLSEQDAHGRST